MIKENTKRTLVWLFPAGEAERWLTKARISLVIPDLTEAGLRSLIYTLEKKQLILSQKSAGEISYGLTSIGKALIETEIAGLKASSQAATDWSVLVFLQAPASDRNFRYLRLSLLQHRWQTLARGVFIYPGQPSESIMLTIQRLYARAVLIMGVADWKWGDIRLVIGQATNSGQLNDIYSGISRELDGLISEVISENELNQQAKSQFLSVFNRLYTALKLDFTQVGVEKPMLLTGVGLLSRLQLLG